MGEEMKISRNGVNGFDLYGRISEVASIESRVASGGCVFRLKNGIDGFFWLWRVALRGEENWFALQSSFRLAVDK